VLRRCTYLNRASARSNECRRCSPLVRLRMFTRSTDGQIERMDLGESQAEEQNSPSSAFSRHTAGETSPLTRDGDS
jgi:hypothetical protein